MVDKPKKILIIRTDRLGDVILSTPVIKNLRLAYPKAQIAFLCRPYTKAVLEGNPNLDEVIIYDKYGDDKSIWSSIKFTLDLRQKKFDWAIILHPTNRMHIVSFFAGITYRVGWNKKAGWLLSKKITHTKQKGEKHELEYTLDILREIKVPIEDKTTYLPISPVASTLVEEMLENEGIKVKERFIVIHTSASCISKRWPRKHFSQLIKILAAELKARIILITSEAERNEAKEILLENKVIDFCGKLNIAQVSALLAKASLFISNDSGPVHIAASLNTPLIAIFGRNKPGLSPKRWRPLSENSFYFHQASQCQDCQAHDCKKGFSCLREITPKQVAEKAILMYNAHN